MKDDAFSNAGLSQETLKLKVDPQGELLEPFGHRSETNGFELQLDRSGLARFLLLGFVLQEHICNRNACWGVARSANFQHAGLYD